VKFSGITDTSPINCPAPGCSQLNGTYVLAQSGVVCNYFINGPFACQLQLIGLTFQQSVPGTNDCTLSLQFSGPPIVNYKASGFTDCLAPITLTLQGGSTNCVWPTTVTIIPVGGPLTQIVPASFCMPAMTQGHAPGSNLSCWQPPFVGRLTGSVPTAGAACCGGGDPISLPPREITTCDMAGENVPAWPPSTTVPSCCPCDCGCGCGSADGSSSCGGDCGCGRSSGGCGCGCSGGGNTSGATDQTPAFRELIRRLTHLGPGRLNLSNGNLLLPLRMPKGGLFAPAAHLYYNSLSPSVTSAFGFGWTNLYQRLVKPAGAFGGVTITNGTGSVLIYSNRDGNGRYQPPAGAQNALAQNLSDLTWTETQVDGLALHYNASGVFDRLKNVAGATWTLTHDSGGKLVTIKDPVSGVTSLVYASNNLRRIVDAAGRIVSFTISGGNLTQCTMPDGSVQNFLYDSNHRMRAYVDPDLSRWSLGYDANNFLHSVLTPRGFRTTFSWLNWNETTVLDPAGFTTTVAYNVSRNIRALADPQGHRTSLGWAGGFLVSLEDAAGGTTNLTYRTAVNRTQQLSSVVNPLGATFSILYDTSDRVKAVRDFNAHRTSLTWNSSNERTPCKTLWATAARLATRRSGPCGR
jgi:YD repeat-containing protein